MALENVVRIIYEAYTEGATQDVESLGDEIEGTGSAMADFAKGAAAGLVVLAAIGSVSAKAAKHSLELREEIEKSTELYKDPGGHLAAFLLKSEQLAASTDNLSESWAAARAAFLGPLQDDFSRGEDRVAGFLDKFSELKRKFDEFYESRGLQAGGGGLLGLGFSGAPASVAPADQGPFLGLDIFTFRDESARRAAEDAKEKTKALYEKTRQEILDNLAVISERNLNTPATFGLSLGQLAGTPPGLDHLEVDDVAEEQRELIRTMRDNARAAQLELLNQQNAIRDAVYLGADAFNDFEGTAIRTLQNVAAEALATKLALSGVGGALLGGAVGFGIAALGSFFGGGDDHDRHTRDRRHNYSNRYGGY